MREQLRSAIPGVSFNNPEKSLYTVLSVCFPLNDQSDFLVTLFDMKGVCVSGGSACSSGDGGSHVMKALSKNGVCATLRFSFSKYTTEAEITKAVDIAASILQKNEVSAV
ncbi:Cysteine desulfurase [compost metagenome]